MPIYTFKHPETDEVFEDIRSFKDKDKPYVHTDGVECPPVPFWDNGGKTGMVDGSAEVWKKDPDLVKKLKPKYIKTRDGNRVPYDPGKHS